ncbi:MAG: DUF2752 domain-containing protein [Clostridiales bacterium]|nr:DUF2752 domain-containing protein [Clostridiales bacterium]
MARIVCLIKKHVLLLTLLGAIWGLYYIAGCTCPILLLTGISCPTCGVTRAMLSLFRGDFNSYLNFQPLAFPLVITVVLCFHLQVMKKKARKISMVYIALTLISNIIVCYF